MAVARSRGAAAATAALAARTAAARPCAALLAAAALALALGGLALAALPTALDASLDGFAARGTPAADARHAFALATGALASTTGDGAPALTKSGRPCPPPPPPAPPPLPCSPSVLAADSSLHVLLVDAAAPALRRALSAEAARATCGVLRRVSELPSFGRACALGVTDTAAAAAVNATQHTAVDLRTDSCALPPEACAPPLSLLTLPRLLREEVPRLHAVAVALRMQAAELSASVAEIAVGAALDALVDACAEARAQVAHEGAGAAPLAKDSRACAVLLPADVGEWLPGGCTAVCAALLEAAPTAREVLAAARLAGDADADADTAGCAEEAFDEGRMEEIERGALVLAGWTARSDAAAALVPASPRAFFDHVAVARAAAGKLGLGEGGTGGETAEPVRGVAQRLVWRLRADDSADVAAFVRDAAREATLAVSDHTPAGTFAVRWREWGAFEAEVRTQLLTDVCWAAGALLFVGVYARAHTSSWALTAGAVLVIALSFPLAFFVWRAVLGLKWANALDGVGVFVTLGVAADDVFVLVDHHRHAHWRATADAHEAPAEDRKERLEATVRESISALSVTSLTTAAAFLGNMTSPIPAVRLFGIKVAVSVLTNLALVTLVFPSVMWLAEGRGAFDARAHAAERGRDADAEHADAERGESEEESADLLSKSRRHSNEARPGERCARGSSEPVSREGSVGFPSNVGMFLGGPWLSFLCASRRRAWCVCSALALMLGGAAAAAATYSGFKGPRESVSLMPPGSNQYEYLAAEELLDADTGRADLRLVFGVKAVDNSDLNQLESASPGTLVLDNSFDVQDEDVQLWFRDLCAELGGRVRPSNATRAIEHLLRRGDLKCWADDMEAFLAVRPNVSVALDPSGAHNATASRDGQVYLPRSLPVPREHFTAAARAWHDSFGNYGEGDPGLWFDAQTGDVKAAVIFCALTTYWRRPPQVLEPQREALQAWLDDYVLAGAPAGVGGAFQTTGGAWQYSDTQTALVRSAWTSVWLSLVLAFVVLLGVTWSPRVTLAATACIALCVALFVVFAMCAGWSLGIMESICMTAVVGLSVDYTSHVAGHAARAQGTSELTRLREALVTVGPSVVGAAVTSGGAALFLMQGTVIFFSTFGSFVLVTTAASLFAAVVAFPTLAFAARALPPCSMAGAAAKVRVTEGAAEEEVGVEMMRLE